MVKRLFGLLLRVLGGGTIFDMMLRKECLKKDLKGGFWCGCHEDSELGMLRFRSSDPTQCPHLVDKLVFFGDGNKYDVTSISPSLSLSAPVY